MFDKFVKDLGKAAENVGKEVNKNAVKISKNIEKSSNKIIKDVSKNTSKVIDSIGGTETKFVSNIPGNITNVASDIADNIGGAVSVVGDKANELVKKSTDNVSNALDVNGDGKIDIEDVIILALKTPGVRVDREQFLKTELTKYCGKDVIKKVVETNPSTAGISTKVIDKIAGQAIQYECNCVTGISAALGTAGGPAAIATMSADIAQYYAYMLRIAQKLMYLYGYPEIALDEHNGMLDSETMNLLILCLGVMYGVKGASDAIKALAVALGKGVEKKLMQKALTKGTIYPIVKKVAKWFSLNMTKEIFAGFFKKAIPVAGAVVSGGITYLTFKPCCDKLQGSLKDTYLSNPNTKITKEQDTIIKGIVDAK